MKTLILSLTIVFACIISLSSCAVLGESSHVLTKVEEVAPTCTTDGIGEHYVCSGCDLLFDDAEGKYKILAPKVLPAKHSLSFVEGEKKTCEEGTVDHYVCTGCGLFFADENGNQPLESIVHPGRHNTEIVLGKDATCKEAGYTSHRVCKDCGTVVTPPETIAAQHNYNPNASLWGVTMEVKDGRAYLVIYGGSISGITCEECGEETPLKISADFQHNNNIDGQGWGSPLVYADKNNFASSVTEDTIERPSVVANVNNGLFEAYFDITDLQAGWTLTIHAGLDGKMADLKEQGGGNGVAVYADGKKFSFRLDSNTWKIASIVVSEASENEFNLNGRVNLKEIEEKPYLVYQGAWNTQNSDKSKVEAAIREGLSSKFDIMELNTWATPEFDYVLDVKDDGSITLALCLENLSVSDNVYYMHRGLDNSSSSGDVKLPTGHNYVITIGNIRYVVQKGSDAASWLSSFTVIRVSEIEK